MFLNEILAGGESGSIEQQAWEADADGYAAYHVLAHLIGGEGRLHAMTILKLKAEPISFQNEVLLSFFVVGVGAFLFVRPPTAELAIPPEVLFHRFFQREEHSPLDRQTTHRKPREWTM